MSRLLRGPEQWLWLNQLVIRMPPRANARCATRIHVFSTQIVRNAGVGSLCPYCGYRSNRQDTSLKVANSCALGKLRLCAPNKNVENSPYSSQCRWELEWCSTYPKRFRSIWLSYVLVFQVRRAFALSRSLIRL